MLGQRPPINFCFFLLLQKVRQKQANPIVIDWSNFIYDVTEEAVADWLQEFSREYSDPSIKSEFNRTNLYLYGNDRQLLEAAADGLVRVAQVSFIIVACCNRILC